MDRLNQLRGEAGGSRDSTLDTSAAASEAYLTATDSSKYFSLSEEDSSFDINPIADVSLASTAETDKAVAETDQLISNLSPNNKKNDLLDSYKFDKQIEAANILSGGVDIFDDNDNSYDGHDLVIDDNVVEIDDKFSSEHKAAEIEGALSQGGASVSVQKSEEISEPANAGVVSEPGIVEEILEPTMSETEPTIVSKDTEEVVLQIDGKNVNAIDIGNGLYLYRKHGEEELAAVQIVMDDDQQQTNFKFLKVRENAEGNLEVYEEIEVEVPVKEGKPAENASHYPVNDINETISEASTSNVAERTVTSDRDNIIPSTSKGESTSSECGKNLDSEKPETSLNGKMVKYNETRKSPVIHSTPNKEGIPLTKTMVDQQLHPNRHLDNVKTIEVHTDNIKQKMFDVQSKNKESDENKERIETSANYETKQKTESDSKEEVKIKENTEIPNTTINERAVENKTNYDETSASAKEEKYPVKEADKGVKGTRKEVEISPSPQNVMIVDSLQLSQIPMNTDKSENIKSKQNNDSSKEKFKHSESNNALTAVDSPNVEVKNTEDVGMQFKIFSDEDKLTLKENNCTEIDITTKTQSVENKQLNVGQTETYEANKKMEQSEKNALDVNYTTSTSQKQKSDKNSITENLLLQDPQTSKNIDIKCITTKMDQDPKALDQNSVNSQGEKDEVSAQKPLQKLYGGQNLDAKPTKNLPQMTEIDTFTGESEDRKDHTTQNTTKNFKPGDGIEKQLEQPKKIENIALLPITTKSPGEVVLTKKEIVIPQVKDAENEVVNAKPIAIQNQSINVPKNNDPAKISTTFTKMDVPKATSTNKAFRLVNVNDSKSKVPEVKNEKITSSQTSSQNRPEVKNVAPKLINNNQTAIPFGKWTAANSKEFLNKIKETKVPTTSSNTKQLKQPNDLNRRDVLQKIDSQRQSNYAANKTQELARSSLNSMSHSNIKRETKTFVIKPVSLSDNKLPVKTETPAAQITVPSNPVHQEPRKTVTKIPIQTVVASEIPKKETSQRKEINNQDLIDRTIEGIINRAVSGKPQDIKPNAPLKAHVEASTIHTSNNTTKDNQVTCLDAIEKKMNELHGIPFVERPAHELPNVYYHDKMKTYAKSDNQKTNQTKCNKIPNLLPFTSKAIVKENIVEIDSEEEIIEHEPVTGDIDKNKNFSSFPKTVIETSSAKISTDDSKKETIITEKDFDKFARRNSKTFENCLTVNFEHKDQPNVVQTVVEKDSQLKKYSRNELLLAEAKVKSYQKQKSAQAHAHASKIQITSKLVPVADDTLTKNFPSKVQLAYQALTTKRQMEPPITIIEDKPVKVVFMHDTAANFTPSRLNVQGQELSPTKKPIKEADAVTISTCDSLDSDVLDSADALDGKAPDEIKIKTKHQRKQVLTPVETPELELIDPSDLGISISPKKKRKLDDSKPEKSPKSLVPKKSYLLARSALNEDPVIKDSSRNILNETVDQPNAAITHKTAATAIDNLVKAAELLETQSEVLDSTTVKDHTDISNTEGSKQNNPVKRGRGRPRKYPLPDGTPSPDKVKGPQRKARLIEAKKTRRHSTTEEEEDDDTTDDEVVKENWTMGKINENIVCPICNKLFRSENVVFKHVKHCTGPSPNRSNSDKRSPRRSRMSLESESKSRGSQSDDMETDEDIPLKKTTLKKRSSKYSSSRSSTDQDDVIVVEDTPSKGKNIKNDQLKKTEPRNVAKTAGQKASNLSCEHCGKAFRQLSHLVAHKQQHKKDYPKKSEGDSLNQGKTVFSCEICKKEFRKLHHLVQHRLIHITNIIPQRTSRKSSFEQTDNKAQKDQDSSKQTDDQTAAFRCEPCDKSFRKLHHLVEHRETHDGINRQKNVGTQSTTDKPATDPPPPQCDICKKTFRKLHHLIEHKELHVENNSEKSDDKSVKSSLSTRDIIHECSLCYMVFPNEQALNKHTITCQRKKRQSATKQTKLSEETETQQTEDGVHSEENKNEEIVALNEENEKSKENIVLEKTVNEEKHITVDKTELIINENSESKNNLETPPAKRDYKQTDNDTFKVVAEPEVPVKVKKLEEKEKLEQVNSIKEITPKKKIKDKDISSTITQTKVPKLSVPEDKTSKSESSDDDEIRYMLNPAFKADDKEEKFMKVRANKRSSLQIERPNSKDRETNLVKRRTSLQHPPKIPRLKPKPLEAKLGPAQTSSKIVAKAPKSEPPPSSDSDDSDVKYSFPKTFSNHKSADKQKTEINSTPKEKRKSVVQKRKSLVGIAKKKSLVKTIIDKKKDLPVKQIRRRTAEVEHRCDCGQLFNSAALLSRHTTLAHTPPRIRKRRSPPPASNPPPVIKPARKSSGPKATTAESRKSSVRSDASTSADKTKKAVEKEANTPVGRGRTTDKKDIKTSTTTKPKSNAAHRGVPLPEKMKKLANKLK